MPEWFWPTVIGILMAIVGAVVGFGIWVVTAINEIRVGLAEAKTQAAPLSILIEKSLMGLLHHDEPEYAEPDSLIDEYLHNPAVFTSEKRARLEQLSLERSTSPKVSELEQQRAKALLAFMKIVVIEKQTVADSVKNALLSFAIGASLASYRHWHH